MKERPIIFSGPMVRAILEGRKTQTRRVVKPQPVYGDVCGLFAAWQFKKTKTESYLYPNALDSILASCPYGQPGDWLWVREAWAAAASGIKTSSGCLFAADGGVAGKFKPSIHMPRWASRITLEIVSVRVERLQDISEADAKAEACDAGTGLYTHSFHKVWEKINGPVSWALNPWVWVVEFKRVEA